jgi:hypothetical protein
MSACDRPKWEALRHKLLGNRLSAALYVPVSFVLTRIVRTDSHAGVLEGRSA